MRKLIFLLFVFLLANSSFGQLKNTSDPSYYKPGTQIYYIFQQPDETLYQNEDFFSKPFEKQIEISDHFLKETPWYADMRTIKITKVQKDSTGAVYIGMSTKETKKPQNEFESLIRYKNGQYEYLPYSFQDIGSKDSLHFVNTILGVDVKLSSPDSNKLNKGGFIATFPVIYPEKMTKSQSLPDCILSFSINQNGKHSPIKYNSGLFKSAIKMTAGAGTDFLNNVLKSTQEIYGVKLTDEAIGNATISETWLKNRQIAGMKSVTVNGKSYDAYLVKEEVWTYTGKCIAKSANDWLNKYSNHFDTEAGKLQSDAWRQKHRPNAQGFMVETRESWYIPGLGPYTMNQYNTYGVNNYILELKAFK